MDDAREIFVDGMGAAAATSGVLTQLEGRIFALLYLQEEPLALEDVAAALGQSKSNISVNIRGLVDWHLVRRVRVPGSRKDHYEAAPMPVCTTGCSTPTNSVSGVRNLMNVSLCRAALSDR